MSAPSFFSATTKKFCCEVLGGDADLISKWCEFGGAECLKSYGLEAAKIIQSRSAEAVSMIRNAVPKQHVKFLEAFDDSCRFGDYLFVHAGIRPGIGIDQQRQSDLRWIREPFLFDETDHGFIVVHGHTIRPEVEMRPNRIGIDTGAYPNWGADRARD